MNGVVLRGVERGSVGAWFIPPAQVLGTVDHATESEEIVGRAVEADGLSP